MESTSKITLTVPEGVTVLKITNTGTDVRVNCREYGWVDSSESVFYVSVNAGQTIWVTNTRTDDNGYTVGYVKIYYSSEINKQTNTKKWMDE